MRGGQGTRTRARTRTPTPTGLLLTHARPHTHALAGLLPEFAFESARETFIKNHQMPGFEKADWKSDM